MRTDNGVEFSGTTRSLEGNHFRKAVISTGAEHRYIPPGHCNANADVESIHATIEEEFYNRILSNEESDAYSHNRSTQRSDYYEIDFAQCVYPITDRLPPR